MWEEKDKEEKGIGVTAINIFIHQTIELNNINLVLMRLAKDHYIVSFITEKVQSYELHEISIIYFILGNQCGELFIVTSKLPSL